MEHAHTSRRALFIAGAGAAALITQGRLLGASLRSSRGCPVTPYEVDTCTATVNGEPGTETIDGPFGPGSTTRTGTQTGTPGTASTTSTFTLVSGTTSEGPLGHPHSALAPSGTFVTSVTQTVTGSVTRTLDAEGNATSTLTWTDTPGPGQATQTSNFSGTYTYTCQTGDGQGKLDMPASPGGSGEDGLNRLVRPLPNGLLAHESRYIWAVVI